MDLVHVARGAFDELVDLLLLPFESLQHHVERAIHFSVLELSSDLLLFCQRYLVNASVLNLLHVSLCSLYFLFNVLHLVCELIQTAGHVSLK